MDEVDITDIRKVLHPTAEEYTFVSAVHSFVLTDHNGIKLEINSKENYQNHSNSQRLNNLHNTFKGSMGH
jgi:hypothetical protein